MERCTAVTSSGTVVARVPCAVAPGDYVVPAMSGFPRMSAVHDVASASVTDVSAEPLVSVALTTVMVVIRTVVPESVVMMTAALASVASAVVTASMSIAMASVALAVMVVSMVATVTSE